LTGNFGHFVAAIANGDGQSCERSAIQLDCRWVSLFSLISRRRSPFPSNPTCDRRRAALCCRRCSRAANRHKLATSRSMSKLLAAGRRLSTVPSKLRKSPAYSEAPCWMPRTISSAL